MTSSNENGWSAIHYAVADNDLQLIRRLLDEKSADLHSRTFQTCTMNGNMILSESTPLHIAANYGNVDIIEFLLSRGADIDALDIIGATPLQFALTRNRLLAAELFVWKGANVRSVTRAR